MPRVRVQPGGQKGHKPRSRSKARHQDGEFHPAEVADHASRSEVKAAASDGPSMQIQVLIEWMRKMGTLSPKLRSRYAGSIWSKSPHCFEMSSKQHEHHSARQNTRMRNSSHNDAQARAAAAAAAPPHSCGLSRRGAGLA